MPSAYLALVLHAHLPFVRHPDQAQASEENWLFEAISETYLPLLSMLERLHAEGRRFRLTLSISPTLACMLQDPYLQQAYAQQLQSMCRLTQALTQQNDEYQALARFYRDRFADTQALYELHYQRDLLGVIQRLQQAGVIELITTAATHAYLPLLRVQEGAVERQIRTAIHSHQRHFQQSPKGFWLPECAYYPGLEQHLQQHGAQYCFVEAHGLLSAQPTPHFGVYAPARCANGVWLFARDPASSAQVWSAQNGYPGDPDYREFYADAMTHMPVEQLQAAGFTPPYRATSLKYHRVTGHPTKQLYQPQRAHRKARLHAEDFLQHRLNTARHLHLPDRPPLFVACYDAELFGHWWFEGPQWLEHLIRTAGEDESLELIAPSQYQQRHPHVQTVSPSASSWGEHGYHHFWLNPHNDWIYPLLHQASKRLQEAMQSQAHSSNRLIQRCLRQVTRSLLLAQASDWAFMIHNGTTVDYAQQQLKQWLARVHELLDQLERNSIDEQQLDKLEAIDCIFPQLEL